MRSRIKSMVNHSLSKIHDLILLHLSSCFLWVGILKHSGIFTTQIYGSRIIVNILFQIVAAYGSEMVRSGFKPERKSKTLQIAAGISLDGEKQRTSKHNNTQCFDSLFVIKNTSFLCGVFSGYSFPNKHSKYS